MNAPFRLLNATGLQVDCLSTGNSRWKVRIRAPEGYTGHLQLRWELGDLPADEQPWWLVPGCFYGRGCKDTAVPVPRWGSAPDGWVQPEWSFAADRIAYPVSAVQVGRQWRALIADPHYRLLAADGTELEQGSSEWGDSEPQMGFGFGLSQGVFFLGLSIPANEGPKVLRRQPNSEPTERVLQMAPGMVLEFGCSVWQAEAKRNLDRRGVHELLRDCHLQISSTQKPAQGVPHLETLQNATHGLLAWHWVEEPGYMAYTVAYDRCQEFNANLKDTTLSWHFEASGFIGAMQNSFALLWQSRQLGGDPDGERVALKTMVRWCRDGVAPNGLFRGSFHPGKASTPKGLVPNPAPVGSQNNDPSGDTPFYGSCWLPDQDTLHARTAADAVLYLSRFASLLGKAHPFYETAKARVTASVHTALSLQRDDGNFGFIYDLSKNSVREWGGEAGFWWIPALGEAYDLMDDSPELQARMLNGMRKAGTYYAAIHHQRCSGGAPEDIRLALSSESPQAGVMGYRHLHRLDPAGSWLEAWKDSADWLLSFQKVFNHRFERYSLLRGQDFRTFGAQNASTQNTQVHCYGLQCLGDMIRLSRLLGDPYYAQRAHEHACYSWQMLCRHAGHWGGQRGMCTEQFYACDWSIFDRWNPGPQHQQKGTLMGSPHSWCIAFMLLSLEQLESVGELSLST